VNYLPFRPGAASELAMKIEEMLKNRVKNHLHSAGNTSDTNSRLNCIFRSFILIFYMITQLKQT